MNVPPPGAALARIDALWPDLADGTHQCDDGEIVNDTDVPFETDGRGDAWCSRCGKGLLLPGTAGKPPAG
jgi:hypothetical protein